MPDSEPICQWEDLKRAGRLARQHRYLEAGVRSEAFSPRRLPTKPEDEAEHQRRLEANRPLLIEYVRRLEERIQQAKENEREARRTRKR
jgi:hypothetical protein